MTAPNNEPDHRGLFALDPEVIFLNHGSFGACPRAVMDVRFRLLEELEREPVRFYVHELEARLDRVREQLAALVDADPEGMALVPNATYGVNTVLRSLRFEPGDELLVTDHEYNACRNALDFVSARSGARVVVVDIPFPIRSSAEVVTRIVEAAGPKTRLCLVDHVTSPTGLVLPMADVVRALGERGVDVLVDGAHAPGMMPLSLRSIGAAYYTGNCHKWLCAPKSAGFLAVREDRREDIVPLAVSHGYNAPPRGRTRFRLLFDWLGTFDPTPHLALPTAIEVLEGLYEGGLAGLMRRNRALCLWARDRIATTLGIDPPCPDDMIGSLAALPLPPSESAYASDSVLYADPLHQLLFDRFRIEVPIVPWPGPPYRLVRVSAQAYNREADYEALCRAIVALQGEGVIPRKSGSASTLP